MRLEKNNRGVEDRENASYYTGYVLENARMGWQRLVGSLKIWVSLQNIGLFCRALLQKRPILPYIWEAIRSFCQVSTHSFTKTKRGRGLSLYKTYVYVYYHDYQIHMKLSSTYAGDMLWGGYD